MSLECNLIGYTDSTKRDRDRESERDRERDGDKTEERHIGRDKGSMRERK